MLLEKERQRLRFDLKIVDIDKHAELLARYGDKVPVVVMNGKAYLWGKINPVLLKRIFKASGGGQGSRPDAPR
jgi:hypothetical protein